MITFKKICTLLYLLFFTISIINSVGLEPLSDADIDALIKFYQYNPPSLPISQESIAQFNQRILSEDPDARPKDLTNILTICTLLQDLKQSSIKWTKRDIEKLQQLFPNLKDKKREHYTYYAN